LSKSWFAFGDRAGFVHDDCGDFLHDFDNFGIADEYALLSAEPQRC
jgi:hypothetical protein